MSSSDPLDFGVLLNLAFNTFKEALDADLAAAGFDDIGSSFGYVFRLLDRGPCNLSELATQLGMSAPGALKVVEDMVRKGYVSRTLDRGDRRVRRLALTDRARAALLRARQFHRRYESELAQRLGVRKVEATRHVLASMALAPAAAAGRSPRPA
jgi:DNA-binding MarR family transcriptional regulator